ncbi:MAG TPA: primosomal protein N' [Steroidobacteraceae bacterium]|nr:primosomal protein N' [Steroidobacteraceae bacterium]
MDATVSPGVVRVALDVPLRQLFDYAPTADSVPAPGMRVRVPFGRRSLVGVVLETAPASELPPQRLRCVAAVLDAAPVLDAATLDLLRWAADYYHHPIGEVLAAALPAALRAGQPALEPPRLWRTTAAGLEALAAGEPRRAPAQRALLQLLGDGLTEAQLAAQRPGWREAARQLSARGWAQRVHAPEPAPPPPQPAPAPSREQAAAVAEIAGALGRFGAFVLHGHTGSGKTEVYLRVIERALARGEGALVLVPEIGLTPQVLARFQARLAAPLAVLHSGLTPAARHAAWRRAASSEARIVLGTRSAVFTPLPRLGVIIVDEEHDASYKQQEGGFHYSARDLALVRAQRAGLPVVLGSATPCLDTLHNVALQRYRRIRLPRRPSQPEPPRIALVDLRAHATKIGLSTPVLQAMERHLHADGQVLVYLNRRGYAPTLLCTACGWTAPCRDCDARLTVHQGRRELHCHHCGAVSALPSACPTCGFPVRPVGQGTERIEESLQQIFPAYPLVRIDRDAVRGRGELQAAIERVNAGAARILVGTQMITKGHDFQNMTLVAVLNADQGLFSADFRAAERLAQTIVQVAGRAGRGTRAGEVLIQTEYPGHPLLQQLIREGYDGFAAGALAEREQARWPPFSRLAVLRASALTAQDPHEFLLQARERAGRPRGLTLLGPAPAAMPRRAARHHAQLLIESRSRAALHGFLGQWLPQLAQLPAARAVRWALDVDPIELF